MLAKSLESPLDNKEIKPVNPEGNQSWIFTGRTDAEAKVPILWFPDAKSRLIGKDPDSGKDWGQEEKGATKHDLVGWYHPLDEHEFEQTPGNGEGQGSLVCCSPWGPKEPDTTEGLTHTHTQAVSIFYLNFKLMQSCLFYINLYQIVYKQIPNYSLSPITYPFN